MSGRRELFVYYRVPAASVGTARRSVVAAQAVLRATYPGLQARLLRRRDDQPETWMETYALPDAPDGIDAALQAAIEVAAAPLLALIEGPRRIEAFDEDEHDSGDAIS